MNGVYSTDALTACASFHSPSHCAIDRFSSMLARSSMVVFDAEDGTNLLEPRTINFALIGWSLGATLAMGAAIGICLEALGIHIMLRLLLDPRV